MTAHLVRIGIAAALLAGCPRSPQVPAAPDNPPSDANAVPPLTVTPCGGDEALASLSFLPKDPRLLARLDRTDPALSLALQEVSAMARRDDHGLPIVGAFALGQLPLEVELLDRWLHKLGFNPAGVLRVQTPDGSPAWIFRNTCDLGETKARLASAFALATRTTPGGLVATPDPAAPSDSSYSVAVLPADLWVLAPHDRLAAVRTWLASATGEQGPTDPPGRLDDLPAAAVQVVFAGRALGSRDAAQSLHAGSDGLFIDGKVRPK